jgi:hypothetical protein
VERVALRGIGSFMISTIKKYFRKKRLFNKEEILFNRDAMIRHVSKIKYHLVFGDNDQVLFRQQQMNAQGLKYPKTINECDQAIEDLQKWRT